MYKTQFILLALLIGPLSLCQNALVKVTYYFEVNKGTGPLVTEGQLYLNENFSDFVYPDFNRTRPIMAEDFGLPPGTPITELDSGKKNNAAPVIFRLFTDFENNKIYETKKHLGSFYTVWETRFNMDWKITGEQKQIDKFKVTQAKGKFRGRNYTVWFTTDVPVSGGPWKLNGLPGLILEAEDEGNAVKIKMLKIEINTQTGFEYTFQKPEKGILIGLKEFIESENQMRESMKAQALSKLPRNSGAQFPEFDRKKYRLEFDFEWEKKPPPEKGNKP